MCACNGEHMTIAFHRWKKWHQHSKGNLAYHAVLRAWCFMNLGNASTKHWVGFLKTMSDGKMNASTARPIQEFQDPWLTLRKASNAWGRKSDLSSSSASLLTSFSACDTKFAHMSPLAIPRMYLPHAGTSLLACKTSNSKYVRQCILAPLKNPCCSERLHA